MRHSSFPWSASVVVLLIGLVVGLMAAPSALAYNPTPGGEIVDQLRNPLFLATGGAFAAGEAVSGDAVNPASSALQQRLNLELGYVALVGDGRYDGHAGNLGLTVPTRVGVFSGSLNAAGASYNALQLGQRVGINASFAKDLFPNLLVGAGLQTQLGSNAGAFGVGAGLNLGVIGLVGPVGPLPDLRWSVALQQIGIGFRPAAGTTGSPAPFTPVAGLQIHLLDTRPVDWHVATTIAAPSFQNLRFGVGSVLRFFDRFALNVGWEVDLREQLDGGRVSATLLPRIGISARFQTDIAKSDSFVSQQGWNRSEVDVNAVYAPLYPGVSATGLQGRVALGVVDRNPPRITVDYDQPIYISPNNDNLVDDLVLPITITDERYVLGWSLIVSDTAGNRVRLIENKEQRPENEGFQNILDRLLYVRRGIDIPPTIRWDGRTDQGSVAADGEYRFEVHAVDDNGNRGVAGPFTIFVDATPPEVEIVKPANPDDLIFSPNDDGFKDTLRIEQRSSVEDLWVAEIRDAGGAVVLERRHTDASLAPWEWDGRDAEGDLVPDGVYSYHVTATDRAMNSVEAELHNIIVNTEPTPIGLNVDRAAFSPGLPGSASLDGVGDTVILTSEIPVEGGVLTYTLDIIDRSNAVRRTFRGTESVPSRWEFDGRADSGALLPEGPYRGRLEVRYRNGNRPSVTSPPFVLDITPPRARTVIEDPIFSPNGDGRKDTVTILHESEEIPRWQGVIRDQTGTVVRTFEWPSRAPASIEWDGRDDTGQTVRDGEYWYTLSGRDPAGNLGSAPRVAITVDTRETPVFVSVAPEAFSPNNSGVQDTIQILPQIIDRRGIERFNFDLLDAEGRVVAQFGGLGDPEAEYRWDGRGADRQVVRDGLYRVRLTVDYRHGNRAVAVSSPLVVDTVAPQVEVRVADAIFSPDGDGNKDTLLIEQNSSTETLWVARIVPESGGDPLRTWRFGGAVDNIVWDGTDESGNVVPDGAYRYIVGSRDAAGNSVEVRSSPFRVDTRAVEMQLRLSETAFSPNGNGVKDTVAFEPISNIADGVREWNLEIFGPLSAGTAPPTPVFTRSGSGNLTTVVWDGNTNANRPATEGLYVGQITARYVQGAVATARTVRPVLLDRTAPRATVSAAYEVFSPNGDGRRDVLPIQQDASTEDRWVASVRNTSGAVVRTFEWTGAPPRTLDFDALGTDRNRLADGVYTYQLEATDAAGNTGRSNELRFTINTEETPLAITRSPASFSPTAQSAQPTVRFVPVIGNTRGIERYQFRILSATGAVMQERSGTTVPAAFDWDGRVGANRAADGFYSAELTLDYRHGNQPTARSEPVEIDTVAPRISAAADLEVFSPDGDGRQDAVTITQSSDPALAWTGQITNAAGEVVRTWTWAERAATVVWNGTDEAGNRVPDGMYRYEVSGRDAAGNSGTARIAAIEVDTAPARVFITAGARVFSPNGDGQFDTVTFGLIANRTNGGIERVLEILNAQGAVVRRFQSDTVVGREDLVWDGRDTSGRVVDGEYTARLQVRYRNGAISEVSSPTVRLDTRGPQLTMRLEGLPFSPDNDGQNDELTMVVGATDESRLRSWQIEIFDRNNRIFQRFEGQGQPRPRIIWDGRSTGGEMVISAEDYPYRFSAVDEVGNRSEIRGIIPVDILVVRDGDRLRIQISNINFEPNSPALQLDPATPEGQKNVAVLDRLVQIFARYESYRIRVEGHAVNISGTQREETAELQPLSLARAQTVRTALMQRGMAADRISVIGRGGTEPLVPHTDQENRWKNRRVEFILIR